MTAIERAVQAHREATHAANEAIAMANRTALRALRVSRKAITARAASTNGVQYPHRLSPKSRVRVAGATPALRLRLEGKRDQAFVQRDEAMAEAERAVGYARQTRANVKRQRTLAVKGA